MGTDWAAIASLKVLAGVPGFSRLPRDRRYFDSKPSAKLSTATSEGSTLRSSSNRQPELNSKSFLPRVIFCGSGSTV